MTPRPAVKDALRRMLAVLETERQALAGLDIGAITGCAGEKAALTRQLVDASNDNMDEECLSLVDAARRLNEVNRQVRNLVAANVAARLDNLMGAATVYRLDTAHLRRNTYPAA